MLACQEIIKMFFNMSHTIKLYHCQTRVFARHTASGNLFDELTDLIDKFVEVYIGRYERPDFTNDIQITVYNASDDEMTKLLQSYVLFLKKELPKYLKPHDTDLYNIRDDMVGNINKTLYLFTLQ